MAKFLILLGSILIVVGVVAHVTGRMPWLGRLPGDIVIERGNSSCYFPIATSILLSVLLSVLFWLFRR